MFCFSLVFVLVLLSIMLLKVQEFLGGFWAGFNFIIIDGLLDSGVDGAELEVFEYFNGFYVGVMGMFWFMDIFSLWVELFYFQKGGVYNYDGDLYWIFVLMIGSELFVIIGNW